MTGWGIAPEPAKGLRWLRLAAAQNQPDAEALLAMRLLRGNPFPGSLRRVLQWLDQATAQDSRLGEVCLSAVLAASPQSAVRDPQRALLLEKKAFEDGLGVDPTGPEIRAAAQAAEGHFTQAVKSEREAIRRARALGWILFAFAAALGTLWGRQAVVRRFTRLRLADSRQGGQLGRVLHREAREGSESGLVRRLGQGIEGGERLCGGLLRQPGGVIEAAG